ncbi:MAG: aspartyl-tRNA(Asn)/glutamyl-tRNA(Gln) amidotransferase subunit C [Rhodothermales bacterium]|jgi:aspartyl-tRNA(Asn)/glutamyl-tRNA(Gln) amidotransferase subunit C
MSVSLEEVRYVAGLARLSFTPEEEKRMASDLSRILQYMNQLEELNTENVPPMEHVLDRVDVFRPDESKTRISRDEALSNAPDTDGEYFRVPRIL